ncbi:MAG TPA: type 1 glutamine amidotransferase domain-containing protein [Fimbriimonadaceae bacterium]|nr:type 1 glutamine amidotransferase domain-containing protein [Fimbriimonadaceae bacterium]
MEQAISGKRVAILATDGFEQSELMEPKRALDEAGATTTVVSLKPGEIRGWDHDHWGQSIPVDKTVEEVSSDDFDALLLPGGVMNPDRLRMNEEAVEFAGDFVKEGKPVGAICHGPWLLVEADVVGGRQMTSWPSLKTDLTNAGAEWEDSEVIVDEGLVTSRKPSDIPAFSKKLIEEIAEGRHEEGAEEATR